MDTKIIEYVIAIAEEKSLSKAAERLYLTQPALSQRLKKLEEELGTPLFTRDTDGLTITDAGRIYVNGGRSVLQIRQDALKQLTSMSRNNKKVLRFGCATSTALECVPEFRAAFPDIDLVTRRCNTTQAKEDLIMGRMDIAVLLTNSLQHTALEFFPLSEGEFLLSVPEHHPALPEAGTSELHPEALRDDYFILSPAPSFSRDVEDSALKSLGIQPRILCEINDNVSRRYMLNRGLGCGFLPDYTLRQEDTFHTFSLHPKQTFYVAAAYSRSATLSEPMKGLLKLLLNLFDKHKS